MPISITPTVPVISAPSVAPDLVLQPGTVVDAKVLQILANDLVRIAIANLSIDVVLEVPLQTGQTLQLAVSQTDSGVRLAVVGQGAGAAADGATLVPVARVEAAPNVARIPAALSDVLTPLERLAVSTASRTAATQQGSLAPLFANLGVVAGTNDLPPVLQQAVQQLLAQRPSLDQNLTGNDVKNAFQNSGLFLEASLASGAVAPATGTPDLKAALIVLRQTLVSLGATAPENPAVPASIAAPALREISLPATSPPDVNELFASGNTGTVVPGVTQIEAGARAVTVGAALNLLQEILQQIPRQNGNASLASAAPAIPRSDVIIHTSTPPPPFRGALPSAQAMALPSIAPDMPLSTSAHQLLGDTDAAIARQTLLQVASLPDRVEPTGVRTDTSAPRWSFEIPFATPQGTAVTQFEISRDGGGSEVEASSRVWRARFSLDVEPAGPVHVLVALNGDKTSVRMWAERPATAEQLRAGTAQLSQALSQAELRPGDIVIRDGAPTPSAPAPAGHFLDRAL